MTREQKLALIIGFSLILAVGVLISDHLSRARTDTIIADSDIDQPMVVHRLAEVPPGIGESGLPHAGRDAVLAEASPALPAPAINETLPGLGAQAQSDPVTIADLGPREAGDVRPGLSTPPGQPQEEPLEVRLTSSSTTSLDLPGFVPVEGYTRPTIDDSAPIETVQQSRAPTVISAVQQTPPPQKQVTHVVAEGETLYGIAARYYGNGDLWPELLKANKQGADEEGRVFEGARLVIPQRGGTPVSQAPQQTRAAQQPAQGKPSVSTSNAAANASGGYGSYTIKPGDTLSEISQELMGTMRRMNELIELNRDQIQDADDIRVGMKLRYPRGQRA